jgi:hypothetical protein
VLEVGHWFPFLVALQNSFCFDCWGREDMPTEWLDEEWQDDAS